MEPDVELEKIEEEGIDDPGIAEMEDAKEEKKKFKMKVVRHGVEKAVDFAERQATLASNVGAQRIDFLAAGDFNLHRDDVKDALVELAQDRDVGESLAIHCVPDEDLLPRQQGNHRDFILSSRRCG